MSGNRPNRSPGTDLVRGIEYPDEGGSTPTAISDVTVRARRPMPSGGQARRAAPAGNQSDQLNEMSLYLIRGGTPRNATERRMAARMEELSGATPAAYKKGGLVKRAAGGKIEALPVPGRKAGRPPSTTKPFGTKPMAKAANQMKPVAMPAMKKGGKAPPPFKKKGK